MLQMMKGSIDKLSLYSGRLDAMEGSSNKFNAPVVNLMLQSMDLQGHPSSTGWYSVPKLERSLHAGR
jgi:hypothetical protein